MEKLREIIREDWSSVVPDNSLKASIETGGILSGLNSSFQGNDILFYSNRFFVFRRLKKLWELSEWDRSLDLSPDLLIPAGMRGKVSIRMDRARSVFNLSTYCDYNKVDRDSWNWLRGLFGSSGSLFLPRTGYYMVFRLQALSMWHPETTLRKILTANGISFRVRQRNGFAEIAVRDQSSIVGVLSNMKMFRTSLFLEEKAMLRSMKDRANKVVNCDASNIRKTIETAERQIDIAGKLMDNGKLWSLPESLRQLITARIENPTATLRELGESLSRPISKSTVEYRWRKIEKLAGVMSDKNKPRGADRHVPGKG
jgi:hypothetical protein